MPNFTINRKIETTDNYGCNCFATNQYEGQIAGDNSPLDGNIIWYIDAYPGYTVSVSDFDIPNTTPTGVAQVSGYKTFEGAGVPSPILGVVFQQASQTRIVATLYLYPSSTHGISGSAFVMPDNNVSATLDIIGCANEASAHGVIKIVDDMQGKITGTTSDITIKSDFSSILTHNVNANGVHHVSGPLNDSHNDQALFCYTLTAPIGSKFTSQPNIGIDNNDYYHTTNNVTDADNNIIAVEVTVFRGVQQTGNTTTTQTPLVVTGIAAVQTTTNNNNSY